MTILAPTPTTPQHTSPLTGFDVLDITAALRNAAANDTTTLTATDRQALALLTYDRTVCRAIAAWLIERILDGTYELPVDELRARLLLRLIDRLPAVTRDDEHAWLTARNTATPCVVDQIITALASYAATRSGEEGAHLLNGALQTVIRVGKPGVLLDEVPRLADHKMMGAMGALDGDGLLPEPQQSPVDRGLRILAAHAARNPGTTAADTLTWAIAVISAEVAHADPSPIPDSTVFAAHEEADRLVEQERKGLLAAEYGEQPATATR